MLTKTTFVRLCNARDRLADGSDSGSRVSIRDIANDAAMSPFHFIRQFEALFGATPHQFRMQVRLDRAKRLLALSDYSVTDVCFEVGFSSLGSFSDLFARRVGAPPSIYRRQIRSSVSLGERPARVMPGCLTLMAAAFAGASAPKVAFAISEKQNAPPFARL